MSHDNQQDDFEAQDPNDDAFYVRDVNDMVDEIMFSDDSADSCSLSSLESTEFETDFDYGDDFVAPTADGRKRFKSILRKEKFFPRFDSLPPEPEVDLVTNYYKIDSYYSTCYPTHHWCFVGDITHVFCVGRYHSRVSDITGKNIGVSFYLDDQKSEQAQAVLQLLKPNSVICIRYAHRRVFFDLQTGIRVEDDELPFVFIIPNMTVKKLLSISDNGCFNDCLIKTHNICDRGIDYVRYSIMNNHCWHQLCKNNYDSNQLARCSQCHMAKYCCKDHQCSDWKLNHKKVCKKLALASKLVNTDLRDWNKYITFEDAPKFSIKFTKYRNSL